MLAFRLVLHFMTSDTSVMMVIMTVEIVVVMAATTLVMSLRLRKIFFWQAEDYTKYLGKTRQNINQYAVSRQKLFEKGQQHWNISLKQH